MGCETITEYSNTKMKSISMNPFFYVILEKRKEITIGFWLETGKPGFEAYR